MQLDNNSDYTVIADAQGTRTQVQFPSQELHKHWRKHQQYVATFQKCAETSAMVNDFPASPSKSASKKKRHDT